MDNALKRGGRYVAHYMALQVYVGVPAVAVCCVWFKVLDYSFSLWDMTFLMVFCTGIFNGIGWISTYFKNFVGFSITRKNFQNTLMMNKVIWAALSAVAFALLPASRDCVGGTLGGAGMMFIISMALCCLGDFYGMLFLKLGKLGFAIYVVSVMVFFMGGIFMVGTAIIKLDGVADFSMAHLIPMAVSPLVTAVVAICGLGLYCVNRQVLKNIEIRS
ncbi:MAG: hypothetical protein RR827_06315 [Oscillospiraceae bacterium]